MALDTGDLTDKTYKAILAEAGRFHHDLTLQVGLLSDECDDKAMFIKMSEELIREMLTYNESELEAIFFEDLPLKMDFHVALNKILSNISKPPNYQCKNANLCPNLIIPISSYKNLSLC